MKISSQKFDESFDLSDMTTSDMERDDTRTNEDDEDEECRRELSNELATDGAMSSDENLDDELDFYDFLEAVSDKMDTITHQSTFTSPRNVLRHSILVS